MKAQIIKNTITVGEWQISALDVDAISVNNEAIIGSFKGNRTSPEQDEANALASVTAVNFTYKNGLDPEKYIHLWKMLWGLAHEFKLNEVERNTIKNMCESAKLS